MAVGLTPRYLENISTAGYTHEQFLALVFETAKTLNCNISQVSNAGIIAYTNNGNFSWNAEFKITLKNEIAIVQSESTGSEMIDMGRNKKNAAKFISQLEELKSALTIEDLENKYEELKQYFVPAEEDVLVLPPPTKGEQIKSFFSIFKPTEGYFVTPILMNINIVIFILMVITGTNIMLPENESLLNWGANFKPMTLDGQPWRLLTNCFLHIGIFHLLMNMYALLYIGVLLEPILGKTRFITAYLLAGITASVASLWWHDLTISAGASGAIFGMYGVFLALLTTSFIEKESRKSLLTSIAFFVGYNLLYGLKGGIDNAAHIGGLLGGIIIGYCMIPSLNKPDNNKLRNSTIGLVSIVILFSSFVAYQKIPNDIGAYDEKIKEFALMEEKALEVYNLPEDASTEKLLQSIKENGIPNWKKSIVLIDDLQKLDLPEEIRTRNIHLKEYCELRIKNYELLYKAIAENTPNYKAQLEDFNKQIEAKLKEVNPSESEE